MSIYANHCPSIADCSHSLTCSVLPLIVSCRERSCGDGTCDYPADFSDPYFPKAFELLNWNWDGNTGTDAGPECVFTMGASSTSSVQGAGSGTAQQKIEAECKRCFAYAQVTLHLVIRIQSWQMDELSIWSEGDMGYEFDVRMLGYQFDWDCISAGTRTAVVCTC